MRKGSKHTEESRRRCSEAKRGKPNGFKGKHHTEETKQKISKAKKGTHPSFETRCKMSAKASKAKKEKNPPIETRRKLSESLKGNKRCLGHKLTAEHKHNISLGGMGRHPTEETRRKLSAAKMGHKVSIEARQKISVGNKGRNHTEEWKHQNSLRMKGKKHRAGIPLTPENKARFLKAGAEWRARLKGHPLPIEIRLKMRHPHKYHKLTPEHVAKVAAWHKGRKRPPKSAEWRLKQSLAHKGRKQRPEVVAKKSGRNCHFYVHGKNFEPYTSDFNNTCKRNVRQRDNHICQLCFKPQNGKQHTIHHINYDKTCSVGFNLITLCTSCNSKVNKRRTNWQRYFQLLIWAKYETMDYPIIN